MGKARILAAPRPNPIRYNPLTDKVRAEPLVLVVCPTRELACQTFDEARRRKLPGRLLLASFTNDCSLLPYHVASLRHLWRCTYKESARAAGDGL